MEGENVIFAQGRRVDYGLFEGRRADRRRAKPDPTIKLAGRGADARHNHGLFNAKAAEPATASCP